MKRMKCYIYTRVSTSMQVDGYSLDAQKDKLRKYAEFQNMLVAGGRRKACVPHRDAWSGW